MSLTAKQEAFCYHYCKHWNASLAAKEAGYSERSAGAIGCENLTKPEVQERIKEIKANLEQAAGLSALSHLLELKSIAYSNITDFKDDWDQLKDFKSLSKSQKGAISEIKNIKIRLDKKSPHNPIDGEPEDVEAGVVKEITVIKLFDKMKALDSIAKILDYYAAEKHTVQTLPPLFPDDDQ